MQRGQLPLEAIIQIILRVLGVAVLIALVVLLVRVLLPSSATSEEKDFQRIMSDFEDLVNQPFQSELTITVPVTGPLTVVAYSGDAASRPQCNGKPCVCLERSGTVPKCETFPSMKTECADQCQLGAKASCVLPSVAVLGQKTITIKRSCNAIGFEGIEV